MKSIKLISSFVGIVSLVMSTLVFAKLPKGIIAPQKGVICDKYVCADQKNGISKTLTMKYLGAAKTKKMFSQGDFDPTEFTLANGVFCDVKTRLCHIDRYFDRNGDRSKVDANMTKLLFSK